MCPKNPYCSTVCQKRNIFFYMSLQAPGAPLLARPVTPTTIIKQCSTVQTTVTATTALQRPPVLQVNSHYI